jgi:hypothetical protein
MSKDLNLMEMFMQISNYNPERIFRISAKLKNLIIEIISPRMDLTNMFQ